MSIDYYHDALAASDYSHAMLDVQSTRQLCIEMAAVCECLERELQRERAGEASALALCRQVIETLCDELTDLSERFQVEHERYASMLRLGADAGQSEGDLDAC